MEALKSSVIWKLSVRLGRCCAELQHGTVLGLCAIFTGFYEVVRENWVQIPVSKQSHGAIPTQSHAVTFPRLPIVYSYVISKWPTHTQSHGNYILVPRAAIFLVGTADRANVAIGLRQLAQGITCACSTLTFFLAVCLY